VYLIFVDFSWLYKRLCNLFNLLFFRFLATGILLYALSRRIKPFFNDSPFLSPSEGIERYLYFDLIFWGLAITIMARTLILFNNSDSHVEAVSEPIKKIVP
jgi:hypothetical protein